MLRILTALVSLALHGGAVAFLLSSALLADPNESALENGSGEDKLVVEQGIALEGLSKGTEEVTVEAVEAAPPVVQPVQPVEEVKPLEDVQHVVGSDAGPEQEKIVREPEPEEIKEAKPQQVAAVEQPTEIAVEEQQAAGKKQEGGDVTVLNAYRGALFSHLSVKKLNPRSRESGTAKVRFSFDPASGQLISHEIVESSGSATLDKAALASVERAAPFPPVPVNIAQGVFEVTVPFKFSVR
ncbi:MAG: TonB family protein [Hyphomicrobium sp.]|jgi:protein TonB